MPQKIILLSGTSAVGKTTILKSLIPEMRSKGIRPCVCKIDCLKTSDLEVFQAMDLPYVIGLSGDICPDHFLVSNLPELWQWADQKMCDTLFIETAGLCHRCSPASERMIAGCVLDATSSFNTPGQLGPMLTEADFAVLTKIDMISQAEKEILLWQLEKINADAVFFPVDGLSGYGIESLAQWLHERSGVCTFENDCLRHSMPSGICSYCVGEQRVGTAFQQGILGKIDFEGGSL